MIAPTPPASIVRDLRAQDPGLRLRWSTRQDLWLIEKKLTARHPCVEKERPLQIGQSAISQDLADAAADGYVHVLTVPNDKLRSELILKCLRDNDLHFHRSWDAINRRLDALNDAEEVRLDRELDTFVEAGSRELFDRAGWLGKWKIQVPNDEVTVQRITPLIKMDGFSILDRRATSAVETATSGAEHAE